MIYQNPHQPTPHPLNNLPPNPNDAQRELYLATLLIALSDDSFSGFLRRIKPPPLPKTPPSPGDPIPEELLTRLTASFAAYGLLCALQLPNPYDPLADQTPSPPPK